MANASLRIGCLIMAAGSASRFGQDKLTASLDGKTLICRALDAVPAELFSVVTVVTQYPQIEQLARQRGFSSVRNTRPEQGLSRTIRLGTEAMADCDGIVYMVADQPLLQKQTLRRMVFLWKEHPQSIVCACCGGVGGNPNLFPSRFFSELTALSGDQGGRAVIRRHEDACLWMEASRDELFDCDTPQQLQALEAQIDTDI